METTTGFIPALKAKLTPDNLIQKFSIGCFRPNQIELEKYTKKETIITITTEAAISIL
jgi:hypothetical protein